MLYKNMIRLYSRLLFIFFVLVYCYHFAQYIPKNLSSQDLEKAHKWVSETYDSLSDDERLGQLFVVALYTNIGKKHIESVRKLVLEEKIGGIILMQDNAEESARLVKEFQSISNVPMFVGIDAEWGLSQRFPTAHKFPWAMTLGAIQNNQLIYEMASKIAQDAKKIGINWIFAPVVDINTNQQNPVIGNRSFGSDVKNVIEKSLAYVNGLQDNGVLATIKHFPGHGDTDKDSHVDLPIVNHKMRRLKKVELAPFKALADKNVGGIMVAHLYVPAMEDKKNIPATISKNIISNILKKRLKYKGLIVTDALNMGAVSNKFKAGDLEKKAFEAGNDIMLFSKEVILGKKFIQQAINNGEISSFRIEESVKKILLTKYFLKFNNGFEYNSENTTYNLNNEEHHKLSEKLYQNAITLIKDEKNLLPLRNNEIIYYLPLGEGKYEYFADNLNKNTNLTIKIVYKISEIPKNAKVMVGLHQKNSAVYKRNKITTDSYMKILHRLSDGNDVILCLFGSPYILGDLDVKNISTILVSYENNEYSQKATIKSFFVDKNEITGIIPVSIDNK